MNDLYLTEKVYPLIQSDKKFNYLFMHIIFKLKHALER